ncbi:MAG: hypothetical protein Q9172_000023 [Xanthocarpia lactea]
MAHTRGLLRMLPRSIITRRTFSTTGPAFVNVGDRIPPIDLVEGSPGNKVNLAKELQGKGLIIGVPAAFSPSCSATHIPGYINSPSLKSAGKVFVVSINDAFVMKAWGESLDPSHKSGVSMSHSLSIVEDAHLLEIPPPGDTIPWADDGRSDSWVILTGS